MDTEHHTGDVRGNLVLNALPAEDRQRVIAQTTPVWLDVRTVLFEPGEPITVVHFPLGGVISLVTPLEADSIVEVATVGNEGIVGVPLQEGGSLAVQAICQVAGEALRMDAGPFLAEFGGAGPLRDRVQHYVEALFGQISQAAACNRLHTNEERLSRWLLMSSDRVGGDEFEIAPDFLGQMLGSRRATVTLSAGLLAAAGLIRYRDGVMVIRDRAGLEEVSCGCYGLIRRLFDPLAPAQRSTAGRAQG